MKNNTTNTLLRHIPNLLTCFRLLLIIPFVMSLFHQQYVQAFYIFILAGFTDGLDGLLARHFHWQSFFGSFVDPLADKLLVASSFISLALIGILPWWLVVLVFLRDVTISLGVLAWFWLIKKTPDFKPTLLSKLNTTLQLALVTVCLFELAYFQFPQMMTDYLIYLTALTTAITFTDYIWT
jgi:cardiolipin synthase (CMP-forming)